MKSEKKCSIENCGKSAIRTYPLFNDKPSFIRLALCKEHSKQADESLRKRGIKNLSRELMP